MKWKEGLETWLWVVFCAVIVAVVLLIPRSALARVTSESALTDASKTVYELSAIPDRGDPAPWMVADSDDDDEDDIDDDDDDIDDDDDDDNDNDDDD